MTLQAEQFSRRGSIEMIAFTPVGDGLEKGVPGRDPETPEPLVVTVAENGTGFSSEANAAGFGLRSMQGQARRLG